MACNIQLLLRCRKMFIKTPAFGSQIVKLPPRRIGKITANGKKQQRTKPNFYEPKQFAQHAKPSEASWIVITICIWMAANGGRYNCGSAEQMQSLPRYCKSNKPRRPNGCGTNVDLWFYERLAIKLLFLSARDICHLPHTECGMPTATTVHSAKLVLPS